MSRTVILAATRGQGRHYARRERAGDESGVFYTSDTNLHGLMLGPEDEVLICPGAWRHPKYADHLHYLAHVIAKRADGPRVRYLGEIAAAEGPDAIGAWQLAADAREARLTADLATAADELAGVKEAHARELEHEREVCKEVVESYLRMKSESERNRALYLKEAFRRMEAELRLIHIRRLLARGPAVFIAKHLVQRLTEVAR